eukprot:scaffold305_cov110-Cylindrotheca_fusiformis.AAC.20
MAFEVLNACLFEAWGGMVVGLSTGTGVEVGSSGIQSLGSRGLVRSEETPPVCIHKSKAHGKQN